MTEDTATLFVRLPANLLDQFKEQADREGRTLVEVTRRAVTAYLKEPPQ
jgi:hypothetical protein